MGETTLDNIRVGDRVYSTKYGWGYVTNINNNVNYPIEYKSDLRDMATFTLEGFEFIENSSQSLFWDEPIAPPRPKRKMSKTVERFISEARLVDLKKGFSPALCYEKGRIDHIPVTVTYEWEE